MADMNIHTDTFEFPVGAHRLEISRLLVAESRAIWSALQPCLAAFIAALEVEAETGGKMGLLGTASIHGSVSDNLLEKLISTFSKHTVRLVKRRTTDGEELDDRVLLTGAGQIDETFGGAWEDLMSWLDFCVELNFRVQLEKQRAASKAVEAAAKAAKAQPKAQ